MAQNNGLPTWVEFSSIDVKDGMTVGYNQSLEQTGQVFLDRNRSTPTWRTVIKGQRLLLNSLGVVVEADPGAIEVSNDPTEPTMLKVLTWDMDQTYSVVTGQTRATGGFATLTESTLRDQFAMNILNAMIAATPGLKDADDASMFSAATIAYRFAEAMMRSAADYRPNEDSGSSEQQETGSDTVISGSVKIENTVTNSVKNPLIVNGSGTNGELTVKGNNTAGEGTSQVSNAINVAIVAGGGGGTSSVDLDDLIGAMGYAKEAVPSSGDTQADKFDALTTAVANAGKLKSSDVDSISTESEIAAVVVFKLNANNPYKVTPYTLTKAMYTYLDGRYALKLNNVSDPTQITYAAGNYYNITSQQTSGLSITLPALSVTGGNPVKIFIVRASISGTLTVTFSGTLKWRGSKQTSLSGEYEIDFIDNGSCWTVGVTEIVSN